MHKCKCKFFNMKNYFDLMDLLHLKKNKKKISEPAENARRSNRVEAALIGKHEH